MQPLRRYRILSEFFTRVGQTIAGYDEIYHCHGGAAMWVPPGSAVIPADRAEEFETRLADLLRTDAEHTFELGATTDAHQSARRALRPLALGVQPAQQGTGIGSRLLTQLLEAADRTTHPRTWRRRARTTCASTNGTDSTS